MKQLRCLAPSYSAFVPLSSNGYVELAVTHLLTWPLVLRPHLERQGLSGGQNKLSVEDQLLVQGKRILSIKWKISRFIENNCNNLPFIENKLS